MNEIKCELCGKDVKYQVYFYDGQIAYLCEECFERIFREYEEEISCVEVMSNAA
jgi:ribosome-binding protein aMBF1 (putative translation factor)